MSTHKMQCEFAQHLEKGTNSKRIKYFGRSENLFAESLPLRLDVRQVLLALIFAAAFLHQAVLAPDAFQSAPWPMGRSNSRMRRRAPKVGSVWRKATNCSSLGGGVLCGW